MAGYSGVPLPKKLLIRAGKSVALMGAPKRFENTLGALPEDVSIRRRIGSARGPSDIVLLFAGTKTELTKRFPGAIKILAEHGTLWIVWPKKTSPLARDLSERDVRTFGMARGFVDFKICAVDETWSGLASARQKSPPRH